MNFLLLGPITFFWITYNQLFSADTKSLYLFWNIILVFKELHKIIVNQQYH